MEAEQNNYLMVFIYAQFLFLNLINSEHKISKMFSCFREHHCFSPGSLGPVSIISLLRLSYLFAEFESYLEIIANRTDDVIQNASNE